MPESSDPAAAHRLDLPGAALGALGLAGVTYALISAPGGGGAKAVLAGLAGIAALAGFLVVESRSRAPMVPISIFRSPVFRAANLTTFFVYAGLGVLTVFLVLTLQQQAGFSPAAAGSANLPFTALMLLFSARVGGLAQRIGPRILMTVGPLLAASGALLLTRIGADTDYLTDVFPGVLLLGSGMTLTVAPLTTAALGAVPAGWAGVASGINNAVARTAGLLSVAVAPPIVGLSGDQYRNPALVGRAFDRSMLLTAGLVAIGGVVAFVGLRPRNQRMSQPADDVVLHHVHCPVDAPGLQPADRAPAASTRSIS